MSYDPKVEEDENISLLVSLMRDGMEIKTNRIDVSIEFRIDLKAMRQTLENNYRIFLSEDAIKRAMILDLEENQGFQLSRILENLTYECTDNSFDSVGVSCDTLTFTASKFTIRASTNETSY